MAEGISMPSSWSTMAESAGRYCDWIETLDPDAAGTETGAAKLKIVTTARSLLLELLASATALCEEGEWPEGTSTVAPGAAEVTHAEYNTVFRRVGRSLPISYYRDIVYRDTADLDSDEPTGLGDLGDDLADIWRDLKCGLRHWNGGDHGEAAWQWRFQYNSHWGTHAVDALRQLHGYATAGPESVLD